MVGQANGIDQRNIDLNLTTSDLPSSPPKLLRRPQSPQAQQRQQHGDQRFRASQFRNRGHMGKEIHRDPGQQVRSTGRTI